MNALAGVPGQTLPLLKEHLRPVTNADDRTTARLIADLDSDAFAVREKAAQELERLGDSAETALRQALRDKPAPDVRRRVEDLLEKLEGSGWIRDTRAVEVLERMGTAEARELCARLASGAPEARRTLEAKAALARLAKRPVAAP
jgi:hypothetical protein